LCESYNQQKQRDIYRTDKSVNSENSVSYFFLFLCTLKFDLKKKKKKQNRIILHEKLSWQTHDCNFMVITESHYRKWELIFLFRWNCFHVPVCHCDEIECTRNNTYDDVCVIKQITLGFRTKNTVVI